MYYSYKSKKKIRKIYKILIVLLAVICFFYLGVKYQQYIFFWKYTNNKISKELIEISKIQDNEIKAQRLLKIHEICNEYISKNQITAESYLLMAKIYYQLGELSLNKSFTDFIFSNCFECIEQKTRIEFLNSIKNIKKSIALLKSDEIKDEYLLMLAKSGFYTGYYDLQDIDTIINKIKKESIFGTEDIRFLSIINIINKRADYGLEMLNKNGIRSDDIKSQFFLASAYNMAGQYNDSIITYKHILDICTDNSIIKSANINLGKIFYNQSLYKESLLHFTNAYLIDDKDIELKIWIGKNYSELGEKMKARTILNEVLALDETNKEAIKLLGSIKGNKVN